MRNKEVEMRERWVEMDPKALELRLAAGDAPLLVDVRTAPEVAGCRIPGIVWIPLDELGSRYPELDPERETVLLCEHGIRSVVACRFLQGKDYKRLINLTGGMSGWDGATESGRFNKGPR